MHEFKTLIDISFTGTRLPQYEKEIFSDTDLTKYYLNKLCEQYEWYAPNDISPNMAYHYAANVMKSRWPEADHIIATEAVVAYYYARYMIKSRWPEAEAAIITNPTMAYFYAYFVMGSRWPEAEPVISADCGYRKMYNNTFGLSI